MKLQNVIINRIQGRIVGARGRLHPLRLINRKKLGTLRKYDGKGNGNLEKAIKTTTLQVNFLCRLCTTTPRNGQF